MSSVLRNYRKIYTTPGADPSMPGRVYNLETNEYKVTYYQVVTGTSGTLTVPSGGTINSNEFGLSGNAILSKVDVNGKPTFESPVTSGGSQVTASLNVLTGAWVASGVYTSSSVALIYSIKIKGIDYHNLVYNNIIETVKVTADVSTINLQSVTDGGSNTTHVIETTGYVKTGGTSSQFLKADGSVDSTAYLTTQVVPAGGTTGQILAKVDDNDYNLEWIENYANYTSVLKHTVKAGEAINKGQAVYVSSADGTNMIVSKASNTSEATSSKTMGLLAQTLATNGKGFVITEGLLDNVNTFGATAGDPVWLGTSGNLIYGLASKPYAPAHLVFIGIVTRVSATVGEIFVKVQNGFELNEIHDVDLKTTTPINGHILGFNGTLWVNKTIAGWLGYTPYDASNPSGFITSSALTPYLTSATAASTYYPLTNPSAYISGITSGMVTTALGYTPYNATNPSGFITSSALAPYLTINDAALTYFPIPTGTTSQYLRGDGTLATFPTIPTVTPSALTKTDDTNVTLTLGGSPSTALLAGTSITVGWTGTLADGRIASAATWNAKQDALSGTGFVKSTAGVISYDTNTYLTTSSAASTYVPYTGATGNVDLGTYTIKVGNGTASATAIQLGATANLGLYSSSANKIDFVTQGITRMSVNANGTVVMGSASTNVIGDNYLDYATNATGIRFTPTTITLSTGTGTPGTGVNYMRMFQTGNITIQNGGTFTDNGYRLEVVGTSYFTDKLAINYPSLSSTYKLGVGGSMVVNGQIIVQDDSGVFAAYSSDGLTQSGGFNFNRYVGVNIYSSNTNPIKFAVNSAEALRIFNGGNILIQNGGTFTNNGFRLDVNGTGRFQTSLTTPTINGVSGLLSFGSTDRVSVGNYATPSAQRIFTIGQDTAWVTIGSLPGATNYGAIFFNQATPSIANAAMFATSGAVTLQGTANVYISAGNFNSIALSRTNMSLGPYNSVSGATSAFTITNPVNTGQTASTSIAGWDYKGGSRQWNTGNIGTQSENVWGATTYSFVGASTITNAYGNVFNAPIAGTNATITNNWAAQFNGRIQVTNGITVTNGGAAITGSISATGNGYFSQGVWSNQYYNLFGVEIFRVTFTTNNFLIGTTTDSGYRLDVNGTGRFQNTLRVTNNLIAGFNTTPRTGTISDGVTSVLGNLQNFTTNYHSGEVLYSEVSGEALNFGQLCYRNAAGKWQKATGSSSAIAAYNMLGICLHTVAGIDTAISILTRGYVESTYLSAGAVGSPLFMDATTAGSITDTAPSTAGNIVRIIGNVFWSSATQTNSKWIVYFNPDNTWIEL
jgi:hypothetical protein